MARAARTTIARISVGLALGLPVMALVMFLVNPFQAGSMDPRERLLGHGIHRVAGISMEPTLPAGQVVISEAGYYHRHAPTRGELALFRSPEGDGPRLKRIVGLPGETVAIERGVVLIDGQPLHEPYVARDSANADPQFDIAPTPVPADSYYMLGDNRAHSMDSRMWGAIARRELLGRLKQ